MRSPVPPEVWDDWLATSEWYTRMLPFMARSYETMRETGRLHVACWGMSQWRPPQGRPKPITPKGFPWGIDDLFVPTSVQDPGGGLPPRGRAATDQFTRLPR